MPTQKIKMARFNNLRNVTVRNRTTATAGRLLTFPSDRELVVLPLPEDLALKADKGLVDLVTLEGDSLEGIGLFDGDRVLCQTTISRSQIKPSDICIVYLQDTNETLAKRVIFDGEYVTLKSFNPDVADILLPKDKVQVQGVVLELLMRPEADGTFFREPKPARISRLERKERVRAAIQAHTKPPFEEPF